MKVVTLLENRTSSKALQCMHGLSLYIETEKHKILFDMGENEFFINNANKLDVDLKEVDIAIISHGHNDHGGGLKLFLELNDKAMVYVGEGAFNKMISKKAGILNKQIGLNVQLKNHERLVIVKENLVIDDEMTIFKGIDEKELLPPGNKNLYTEDEQGEIIRDTFAHEINMLIKQKEHYYLFAGCAHKGIVNIIEQGKKIVASDVDTVIGGFHLKSIDTYQDVSYLSALVKRLNTNHVKNYYTCHCTGEKATTYLEQYINSLNDLKTGTIIEL